MSAVEHKAKCIEWRDKWKEGKRKRSSEGLESLFRPAFDVNVCVYVFAKHVCELNITDEWKRTAVGGLCFFFFVYLVD